MTKIHEQMRQITQKWMEATQIVYKTYNMKKTGATIWCVSNLYVVKRVSVNDMNTRSFIFYLIYMSLVWQNHGGTVVLLWNTLANTTNSTGNPQYIEQR